VRHRRLPRATRRHGAFEAASFRNFRLFGPGRRMAPLLPTDPELLRSVEKGFAVSNQ